MPTGGLGIPSTTHNRSKELIARLWPVFAEELLARLDKGAEEYGDKSLQLPMQNLLTEIEQEYLDTVGWGFIGWLKVQELKDKVAALEGQMPTR
jgi:hypothetical protein